MGNGNTFNTSIDIKGLSVQLAHSEASVLSELVAAVESLEMKVLGRSSSSSDLLKNVRESIPDIIIAGMCYNDGSVIDTLLTIAENEPLPAIIVAREVDLADVEEAMGDHVMAYLIAPVDHRELRSTCYLVMRRFEQFQELRQENAELKEALQTRKKLERAKGIVMEKYDLTEEQAYLKILDVATQKRMKVSDIAEIIIKSTT